MKSSELFRKLKRAGWYVVREGKGSHMIMAHADKPGIEFPFPFHGSDEIGKGLEKRILKLAGLQ